MSSFFKLTRKEQKGLIGFLVVFGIIISIKLYKHEELTVRIEKASVASTQEEIDQPIAIRKVSKPQVKNKKVTRQEKLSCVKKFNPNSFSVDDWMKLGLTESISARTYKFLKLKSGISKPNDLLQVYGFKQVWIDQLKDSMVFEVPLFDIQKSSAEVLSGLSGIGPKLSNRIVRYRNALGGFTQLEQIKEVYGIDSALFKQIYPFLRISDEQVQKIDLLNMALNELSQHPYISYDEAFSVISIRSEKGTLENSDLIDIFGESGFKKLKGYLHE